MAKRVADLGKAVEGLIGGRKRLAQTERTVVKTLNRALGRIGYKVVAKAEPERERRRQARKKVAARKRRRRKARKRG